MSKAAVLARAGHTFICALAVGLTCLLSSEPSFGAPASFSNQDCLDCHTDPTTSRMVSGKSVPMAVFPTNDFKTSMHGKLNCVDCHRGFTDLVHEAHPPAPRCDECHEAKSDHDKAVKNYAESIHGVSKSMGASAAANCSDCHTAHNIMSVKDPASPVYKLNLPRTCAKCHSNPGINTEYRMKYPEVGAQYTESMHGKALLKMGLIVAPSCNDCHGVHDIKRSVDRTSSVNHANVATTCGKCHLGIEKQYESSVHGQLLAKGDKRGPVCTDCHTAHTIGSPELSSFKEISDERCGRCHQDRLEHYRDTYHGKAMALGKPNAAPDVAACYDCHGAHDVLPQSNPASRLSKANIVGTCRKCHSDATESFAQYVPHANPMDPKNYPALTVVFFGMTSLLVGVFGFFGLHTALWIFRSGYLYVNDSKAFREAKIDTQRGGEWFTRFAPYERFLHFLVVTSFLLLVVTGMPLKFYYTSWAKVIFNLLGGTQVARVLHHFGAMITFLYFGLHLSKLVVSSWRKRGTLRDPATGKWSFAKIKDALFGPDSMIPT
ncbi:MAG: Cytochrome b subunit of formate dehydrogenase-like protein [Verrucomicrobiales bacterium]|nr:Cytochrome b subunit of formate dehydrogenase-like protein [Verrucomicrobiales bacterium]